MTTHVRLPDERVVDHRHARIQPTDNRTTTPLRFHGRHELDAIRNLTLRNRLHASCGSSGSAVLLTTPEHLASSDAGSVNGVPNVLCEIVHRPKGQVLRIGERELSCLNLCSDHQRWLLLLAQYGETLE